MTVRKKKQERRTKPFKSIIKNAAVIDPQGMRARLTGIATGTAAANTATPFDWTIPQLQFPAGTNVKSLFDGIEYYAEDSTIGDHMKFQMVDPDGSGVAAGLYSQAVYDAIKDGNNEVMVEEFGDCFYVAPNKLEDIVLYKAALYPGLVIRIIYTNTHATNAVNFMCNIFRHIDP